MSSTLTTSDINILSELCLRNLPGSKRNLKALVSEIASRIPNDLEVQIKEEEHIKEIDGLKVQTKDEQRMKEIGDYLELERKRDKEERAEKKPRVKFPVHIPLCAASPSDPAIREKNKEQFNVRQAELASKYPKEWIAFHMIK